MKTMKRFLAVLLTVVLLVGMCAVAAFAEGDADRPTAAHLSFRADGTFKILQIADLQDDEKFGKLPQYLLRAAVIQNDPDLIVMTGDNIAGYSCKTEEEGETAIRAFMDILEPLRVPVAIVFGNHDDDQTALSKEDEIGIYETYSCFIGCKGVIADKVYGDNSTRNVGTYNIPVFASADSDKVGFNIWCFDSGNYNPDPTYGGYSYVLPEQVEWYKQTSEKLQRDNGGALVPSVAFQHIPPVQIYKALQKIPVWIPGAVLHEKQFYCFPKGVDPLKNWMMEDPSTPNLDCEEAYAAVEAMAERGDVQAVFFGHDHVNGYSVPYKGIDLVNSPACTFGAYNDFHSGFRVITLHLDEGKYTSELSYSLRLMITFPFHQLLRKMHEYFGTDLFSATV